MKDFAEEEAIGCADQKSFTLTEYPNIKLLDNIFRHPDIYDADRKRIRKYCDLAIKEGKINITYKKKSKYGRYYPEDGSIISGTYMWRKLRASMFADTEYDVDIKSCHFQILFNDTKDKMELNNLAELINNRNELFKLFYINDDAIQRYNSKYSTDWNKKDILKKLLTRNLYGGLFENWVKEFQLEEGEYEVPEWYYKVKEDIQQGLNILQDFNKLLFQDIKNDCLTDVKEKWEYQQLQNRTDKRKKIPVFNPDEHSVPKPKLLSRYFQERESNIIDNVYDYIKKHFKISPTVYCYDGLQFLKNDIPNPDEFINKINSNFDVVFEIKDFDDKLKEIEKEKETVYFDNNEFNMMEIGKEEYFNKYYFRINALDGMCYINNDGFLVAIKNETSHFAKIKNFWEEYKWSQNVREYFSYGTYPCKELCPPEHYNLWTGFDVSKMDCTNERSFDIILDHFKVVANFNDLVYEYLLNYFAWLFQKPHKKTEVCLLIQGKQGSGKTTLVEDLLKKMMGIKYVFNTCDIDKIIGKFNSSIAGKLMTILNEASGKDTYSVIEKIKDSITRKDVSIEHKGHDPVSVTDYCNYCYTTNNVKPLPIGEDDRRFQVIECSDKYKGDTEYFDKLYDAIDNDEIVKSLYNFLIKRDISKFNPSRDRVVTEATTDLHELNREPVDMFLEYLHTDEFVKYQRKYKTKDMYEEFKSYMSSIGYKGVCNLPTFGKVLKSYLNKYNIKMIHPKNVSHLEFLNESWVIECLIDEVEG
jgi:hypothetical protein